MPPPKLYPVHRTVRVTRALDAAIEDEQPERDWADKAREALSEWAAKQESKRKRAGRRS